jgi:hypothetical protein
MEQAHPSHDEYLSQRRKEAVILAKEMLESDEALIVKCRIMHGILRALESERLEEPRLTFWGIDSETDHLPLTVSPELLDSDYRQRILEEARQSAAFFRFEIHRACRQVLERYRDA